MRSSSAFQSPEQGSGRKCITQFLDSELLNEAANIIDNFRSRAHRELLHVTPLEKDLIDDSISSPDGERTFHSSVVRLPQVRSMQKASVFKPALLKQ
jgi:hypothetical protein